MSENGFLEVSLFFFYLLQKKDFSFRPSFRLDHLMHLTALYFTRVSLSVTCTWLVFVWSAFSMFHVQNIWAYLAGASCRELGPVTLLIEFNAYI